VAGSIHIQLNYFIVSFLDFHFTSEIINDYTHYIWLCFLIQTVCVIIGMFVIYNFTYTVADSLFTK